MTSDKDLLIAAAKAAGIEIVGPVEDYIVQFDERYTGGFIIVNDRGGHSVWNPLTDDGDALRLAVKLRIEIVFWPQGVSAEIQGSPHCSLKLEPFLEDPYAATRRAIVRAAAAMSPD